MFFLLLAAVLTSGMWLPSWIQQQAVLWVAQTYHQRLTIGAVDIHPLALQWSVRDVRLYEAQGGGTEVALDELSGQASWSLTGLPRIDRLTLHHPQLHLVRYSSGQWNISPFLNHQSSSGSLLAIVLKDFQIRDGVVDYVDQTSHEQHRIQGLQMDLPLFSTREVDQNHWITPSLQARVDGSAVSVSGRIQPFMPQIRAEGRFSLSQVDLARMSSLAATMDGVQIHTGTLSLAGDFSIQGMPGKNFQGEIRSIKAQFPRLEGQIPAQSIRFALDNGQFSLAQLHFAEKGGLWSLGQVQGSATGVAVQGETSVERGNHPGSHLVSKASSLWHLALDGATFSLEQSTAVWPTSGGQFHAQVGRVSFEARRMDFGCTAPVKKCQRLPVKLALSQTRVQGTDVVYPLTPSTTNLSQVMLDTQVGDRGTLHLEGPVNPGLGQAQLRLSMKHLELSPFQPYLRPYSHVLLAQGTLSGEGLVTLGVSATQPIQTQYRGNLQVDDVVLLDDRWAQSLFRSKSLFFGGVNASSKPFSLVVDQVAVSDFYGRVTLLSSGTLNWQTLLIDAPSPRSPTASMKGEFPGPARGQGNNPVNPATAVGVGNKSRSHSPASVMVRKVILQGGKIHYKDEFIQPHYEADLTHLGGEIAGLSSAENSQARLELRGRANDAPVLIQGQLNPLQTSLYLDVTARVKGMDLAQFSPYSGKYVGYNIERGKLSFEVHYKVQDQVLHATNHLVLNELTFGKPVSSLSATHLPVELAVSLLEDSHGTINVNLPIEGSFNDPQFSVGDVLARMMVHLLEKAVESPFALLGKLFKHQGTVSWMPFPSGMDTLGAEQEVTLQKMAQTLRDHSDLRLDVEGKASLHNDGPNLQRLVLLRKVQAARLKAQVDHGEVVDQRQELTPQEYEHWLRVAYQAETFPKPKNFFGMDKSLSVADMEKLMLANAPVTTGQLNELAQRRADVVQAWLVKQGQIAASRIYEVRDAPEDGNIDRQAPEARVDFILH
ncbi:MAG: DUF748 domain-containing protein [Ferrovum sp.]|nr:DUF748 domain-containing protein [Ferrovum sp.]NDU87681.1 DUF748 domain-containing protein [Ferrovum sp.]